MLLCWAISRLLGASISKQHSLTLLTTLWWCHEGRLAVQSEGDITDNIFQKNKARSAASVYRLGCSGDMDGNQGLSQDSDTTEVNPK